MRKLFDVAILAGGLATRLHPLTESLPKSLINIKGEPFISHQLRLLQKKGAQRIVICTGFLHTMLSDFIGNGKKMGLDISYSHDGEKRLGTAGALKKALPLLSDNFFVLYGDSYLPCDYASVQANFMNSQKSALMTVFHNQGQWDKSNVEFQDGEIFVYDKAQQTARMQYIDYGLGVFQKKAFDHIIAEQPYDLALLYQNMLAQKQLAAYEMSERFYEIGSFAGIAELEWHLKCFR